MRTEFFIAIIRDFFDLDSNLQVTDKDLIAKLQQGDKEAFKQLFNRYYDQLYATSISMTKDKEAAKDVVQDVFFDVWEKRNSLNFGTSIIAYLKRSVINRSINYIKYHKRFADTEQLKEEGSKQHSTIEELAGQELDDVIQKALAQLPDRCRLIFTMKRLEGMRIKEIAGST